MASNLNDPNRDPSVLWEEYFLIFLFRMIRTLRIYPDNNQKISTCHSQLLKSMETLLGYGELTLQVSDFRFYVQGKKLRYHKEIVRIHSDVFEFMNKRGLKGLTLNPSPSALSGPQVILFLRLLIDSAEHEDPPDWLTEELTKARIDWVKVLPLFEEGEEDSDSDREKAKRIYWQTQGSLQEVAQQLGSRRAVGTRKIKRLVQEMVDIAIENEPLLLATSTLKDYDDYTYVHSLNVAVLSIALGSYIGVSPNPLVNLGLCALLHDLGKLEVPKAILNKPSRLSDTEIHEIQKHPLASVRQILRLRVPHNVKSELLLAPFEHHLHYNLSGYPKTHSLKHLSVFGRILQITDFYDAVTSHRNYRSRSLTPPEALKLLVHGSNKEFDPMMVKAFISMVGPYPVGTLLQFDTGEIGLAFDFPRDIDRKFPRVMLIEKQGQVTPTGGEIVDLEEKDVKKGRPVRCVAGVLDPEAYGIQPAEFLM